METYIFIYKKIYIMKKEKTLLIRLDEELHNKYKKLCKIKGYNMSQRIRNFIEKEIKNETERRD